uniref:Uncharacterized protein n=1 Tax=Panagrolaimus sp. JU765 TaxID=591449 RepID=A0AC34R118_9BILA
MRKPLLFLIFFIISCSVAEECPSNIPKLCKCENLVSGFRVSCLSNSNLDEIIAALKDDTIERLDIRNCVPKVKQLVMLPPMSVRVLSITNCGIEKIAENAFANVAADLEELRLINNQLTTMPLLGELPKLVSLNLNKNQLTDIAENSFDGIPGLRNLRIQNNKICTLSRNALNETKQTLELLDLSGNCFSAVPAQNLRNSLKLKHLDLSDNQINELAKFSFMNLPELKELRLHSNMLGSLSPLAFMNVPQLNRLSLRNNLITKIEQGALQTFKEIEVVDLGYNNILKIPSFKDMAKLKQVNLTSNRIRRIETMTFSSNPALQAVNIENNEISLIARNSFDGLDQLTLLLLGNNSLSSIERGTFDGMRNLQQLSLHHNQITEITNESFPSLTKMTVLDLSNNRISSITPGAFENQQNLFWLDLSNNNITTLQRGAFDKKIGNILLDGNHFYCDEKLDWFVSYLVKFQVRTFFPNQPEIACAGPDKFVGTRIKDLMIKKANETINQGLSTFGMGSRSGVQQQPTILGNLLPFLAQGAITNGASTGFLHSITQAIPSLRAIPGLGNGPVRTGMSADFDRAVEQFTEPLVRYSVGSQAPSDLNRLLQSIPNLVVNIPGFGDVDLSKVPPPILQHVLNGGQIPGIPKETLDNVVKTYTNRMYQAAERANQGKMQEGDDRYLPSLTTLPQQVVDTVMHGDTLPYLTVDQSNVVKAYYTKQIPVQMGPNASQGIQFKPEMFSMLSLLPPNYNFSKIPPEVFKQVMKGEMPDLTLLPQDVLDYIRENSEKIFKSFKISPETSLEEILSKLPSFEPAAFDTTFPPYDINKVDSDLVVKNESSLLSDGNVRLYTAIALGLFGTVSTGILGLYCFYLRKSRTEMKPNL